MKVSTRLYDIILILSFVALWISVQIDDSLEYVIGYFLVLSIGVGHGANDLKIYFKDQNLPLKTSIKFICIYTGAVILGFLAFFVVPDLVLALFIIVSGFHFGQEHFERYNFKYSILKILFISCYGLTIIIALLHLNIDYSLPIIHDLIHSTLTPSYVKWTLYTLSAITLILGTIQLWRTAMDSIVKEILYLMVIYIIFASSSLIWGFAIYFILWHSVPSIHHQIQHLHGSVTNKSILKYMKSSVLFWLAALIFLGILYYFLNEKTTFFLSVIVAFLGGVTFPHVVVMHRIHKR